MKHSQGINNDHTNIFIHAQSVCLLESNCRSTMSATSVLLLLGIVAPLAAAAAPGSVGRRMMSTTDVPRVFKAELPYDSDTPSTIPAPVPRMMSIQQLPRGPSKTRTNQQDAEQHIQQNAHNRYYGQGSWGYGYSGYGSGSTGGYGGYLQRPRNLDDDQQQQHHQQVGVCDKLPQYEWGFSWEMIL